MSAVGNPGGRKPARRRWRVRPTAASNSPAAAAGFASIGEWIAERLRRNELKAVIDPDLERDEPRHPCSRRVTK